MQNDESGLDLFKNYAKSSINKIGNQPGLKTKILNAYNYNSKAMDSSLPYILVRQNSVEKAATCFVNLRGKILHKETEYTFSDLEIESIHFIEILQYVMFFKRATYTDQEIELLLGPLYYCNDVYMKKLLVYL